MRIGLISDTHIPQAGRDLWPPVYEALRGVDLILHAGDLLLPEVIGWLEPLAPVMAVSGNGDYGGWQRTVPPQDPRLSESKVLAVDGPSTGSGQALRVGLVHDFPMPESPPLRTFEGLMSHYFGGPVDVIVRGSTHAAEITIVRGVLVVNPGSPTFPNHQSLRLGTIGYLDIDDGRVRPSIVQLR
ncbi:MAG: YfcE family phosphodiesterase [Chloroflexi bacterium]|nr:YfcE family phosphodiesterase [Chloroflexota bacterium]